MGTVVRRDRKWDGDDPRWTWVQKPAPGELRIIQALVNTAPAGKTDDELASPRVLSEWLKRWELVNGATELDGADLARMLEARSALRSLIAANRSATSPRAALAVLDRAAAKAPLRVRFRADATAATSVDLEPAAEGLDGALAKLFEIVALALRDDLWRRLRLCLDDTCGSAFFDRWDNLSTRWCSGRCRTRQSSRAYRRRRKNRGY